MNYVLLITYIFYVFLLFLAIYCAIILTIRRFGKLRAVTGKVIYLSSSNGEYFNPGSDLFHKKEHYVVTLDIKGKRKKFVSGQGIYDSLKVDDIIEIKYRHNHILNYKRITQLS